MDMSASEGPLQGAGHDGTPPGQATSDAPSCYLAYMLRLWRAETKDGPVWRASLESPHTGERARFAGLEALFAFLVEKTGGDVRRTQPRMKPDPSEKGGGE